MTGAPFKCSLALFAVMLGGCSSVPEHPAPQVPDSWFGTSQAQPADAQTLALWWQAFDDPMLTDLVHRAMQQSHDVRLAMLRVNGARSQLRLSRAELFPSIDLPGSASRQWVGNEQESDSPLAEYGLDDTIRFDMWELAVEASWEVDLFGATRARTEGARQMVRSAQAEAIAARIAVASNAAQGYVQIRALQAQQGLLREGIEVAQELERIAGLLFEAGEVNRLDVESAAAERAALQADLGELDINLAEALLALDTLLAEPPGSTGRELDTVAVTAVPLAGDAIAPGQPVDLLRRRPDIVAAAAQLDSAALQSLAARRDLFPTLTLQAAMGRSGLALNNDFSSASNFARLGAMFGLPLLDFGRRGAAIDLADIEGETAYVGFEQALTQALEDVERSLAAIEGQERRHAALERARDHSERAYQLARTSYRLGEANLFEVLEAQRGALQARQQYLHGRTALATAQVALFVALGGGWESGEEDIAQH
ncbi:MULTISPECIES: efflux transporter outer membrane subunit [Pseudomonas]|uniref:efflux transporter outer membrane subunit n=1 Tax=Pseudomonas TaxID=286 RepID=UPI00123958F8|nr:MULTISPECIES: efflux transporter outer membrane subunit [Pseudomonas]QIB52723.1 efflux transporter outer membrane subunit [Pseudomonas sp. OIL-1]